MGVNALTEHAQYKFVVKEGSGGKPFLALEPAGEVLTVLGGGLLSLHLREGTTLDDARKLTDTLNRTFTSTAYTGR